MAENKKNNFKLEDIAVAVKYAFESTGETPKIVASGRGLLAKQIIDLAKENNVAVKEQKDLAESLIKVPVGIEIPPELWNAMAEILAQVYRLNQQRAQNAK